MKTLINLDCAGLGELTKEWDMTNSTRARMHACIQRNLALYYGHHWAKKKKVSSLERCPHFRGRFLHNSTVGTSETILIREVSFKRGSTVY